MNEIFHQNIPVELEFFSNIEERSFTWRITATDAIQFYYLPLIKRPVKIIVLGVVYSDKGVLQ